MQFCGNQDRAKKIVVRTPAKTPGTTSSGQQTNEKKWHSSKNIFSSGFGSSWTSAESGGVGSGRGSVNCSPMQAGSSQAMTAPEPFPGWTVHEQKVLMDQIDANQHSKKHHKHLEMLFEKTHRQLPGKSLNLLVRQGLRFLGLRFVGLFWGVFLVPFCLICGGRRGGDRRNALQPFSRLIMAARPRPGQWAREL